MVKRRDMGVGEHDPSLSSGFWFKSHNTKQKRGEKDEDQDWVHISETRVACRHGTVQSFADAVRARATCGCKQKRERDVINEKKSFD
jgi:hypothetical protein